MLTINLKKIIDEKWNNCWPVSNLRPIAILDLISYIFFIKKLDDRDLITKNLSSFKSAHFIPTKEIEQFTWSMFKDLDAQSIHDLFTKQFGIIDLMSEYGQSGFLYNQFFRSPLLLKPTPKLLLNVIQIINLIVSCDAATQSAIVEYLLNKAEKTQKEPQFIPQFISRLMISISDPVTEDIICDFSAGNGSLLINAAEYIKNKNSTFKQDISSRFKGLGSNASQLRVAAMRMILHGINEPDLQISSSTEVNFTQKPTLFISDLLLKGVEDNIIPEENAPQPGSVENEIILLNEIVKNMEAGSRAVVLVPENLLKNNLPEIQNVRKEIVDNSNLEGVIHLFPNSKSFSAAGILIFNKLSLETTSQVWFCKMEKPKKKRTINETIKNPEPNEILPSEEQTQINLILDNWKNRKDSPNRNSFFINEYDIKTNNYNLNFNDYKLISAVGQSDNLLQKSDESEASESDTIVATKKESLHDFFEVAAPLEEPKRKRKLLPAILVILVLIIAGGWFYLKYFNDNNKLYPQTAAIADSAKSISKMSPDISTIQSKPEQPNPKKTKVVKEMSPAANSPVNKSASDSSQQYTVIDKAWFYYAPDSGKRKTFYLQPRHDLVIVPTAEENGFVYVVYVNKNGQSTRGWLDKKNLKAVE
ncbi:MAG: N-6 DNA methylase [Ginsengibacter sp.]